MQLLLESRADINIRDKDGWIALYSVSIEVASLLLKNRADINIMDNDSYTLLYNAAKLGDDKLV